jgi:hypothetical protein
MQPLRCGECINLIQFCQRGREKKFSRYHLTYQLILKGKIKIKKYKAVNVVHAKRPMKVRLQMLHMPAVQQQNLGY